MVAPLRTAIAPICDSAMMRAVSRTLTSGVTSGLSWLRRSSRMTTPPIAQQQAYNSARQRQVSGPSALRKIASAALDRVGPDAEALERARAESGGDRDVGSVAPARDQDAHGAPLGAAEIAGRACAA